MKPYLKISRPVAGQRGVTLIEALVALMVMSFGMVALVALLGNLRRSTDVGKQRSEAMRIAQAEMAKVRNFSLIQVPNPPDATVHAYEGIASAPASTTSIADSNTTFAVKLDVTPLSTGQGLLGKTTSVEVTWLDRASRAGEAAQKIVLHSIVSRTDPAFAGAASITPPPDVIRQPQGRNAAIPPVATDLGNKTSAYRPSGLGSVVWVFNNTTGAVTKTCAIDAGDTLSTSTVNDNVCTTTLGFVISGTINFSNTNPANPSSPEAPAVGLDMTLTGGTYSAARINDITGLPEKDANNVVIMDTVTVGAPSFQCFDDAPSSPGAQAFVNYSCLVLPTVTSPLPYWSGILKLTNLSIGTTSSDYRVCRYSADYNRNGNAYANAQLDPDNYEHPAFYVKVTGSLARQNFLVVRGDLNCPTAPAVNLSSGIYTDYSTVQLQP